MLIAFIVVFVITGAAGFYKGYKDGSAFISKKYEDEFRYVTLKDMEDIVTDMKSNGAGPDTVFVTIHPDWIEGKL